VRVSSVALSSVQFRRAWIADRASGSTNLPNPFRRPEYKVAEWKEALDLDAHASADYRVANAANHHGDAYLLHAVLFALSLFLLGAPTQVHRRAMQRATLVLGTLTFTLTLISMARLPRARAEPPHGNDSAAL